MTSSEESWGTSSASSDTLIAPKRLAGALTWLDADHLERILTHTLLSLEMFSSQT